MERLVGNIGSRSSSSSIKYIMLIVGLNLVLCALNVGASKITNTDSSAGEASSSEIEISNSDDDKRSLVNDGDNGDDEQMPIKDQISLLSKRLEILTEHRQEDYRMLERSLHSYVQKHLHEHINVDIKQELKDLR
jgi:hypothetical protein